MAAYRAQLEGYVSSFPPALQGPLLTGIERYLEKHDGEAWDSHHDVWLTDKKGETRESKAVRSWTTDGWNTTLVPDADATQWAKEVLGGSRAYTLWDSLPAGILVS
jgi:hypothetical protein